MFNRQVFLGYFLCFSFFILKFSDAVAQCEISIEANGPTTFCNSNSVTLSALQATGLSLQWQKDQVDIPGATNPDLIVNESGDYNVILDSTGCLAISNYIHIQVDTPLVGPLHVFTTQPTNAICQNDVQPLRIIMNSDTLPLFMMSSGISWYLNDSIVDTQNPNFYGVVNLYSEIYTPIAGIYHCSMTNTCNQLVSDSIEVIVNPLPVAEILGTDGTNYHNICAPDSITFFVHPDTSNSYNWYLGNTWGTYTLLNDTDSSLTVNYTGVFSLYVLDSNNCSTTVGDQYVNVIQPPITTIYTNSDTSFCDGGVIDLSVSPNFDNNWYEWYNENGPIQEHGLDVAVNTSGHYFVMATNQVGCSASSNIIDVVVHPNPQISIVPDGVISFCTGSAVNLNATSDEQLSSYQWYNNNLPLTNVDSSVFIPNYSGIFYVSVTDSLGCTGKSFPVYVVEESCASVNSLVPDLWSISPNPSSGILNFSIPESVSTFSIEIRTIEGQIVFKYSGNNPENQFDLGFLSEGVYLIKSDYSDKIERVIIEK